MFVFSRKRERAQGGERFFPLYNSNSRIQLFSRSPSREQRRRYKRAAESQDSKTSGREPRQQKEQSNDNDNDNKNAAASERGGLGGKGFSNFPPLSVKQRSGPKERERGNRGPLPPQESFWKRKRGSEESPVGRRDQGPIPRERPRQGEGEGGGGGKTKKTKQKRTEDEQARRCSCLPRSARAPPPASDDDGHREQVPVV
jgi:hypothetical protein